MSRFHDRMAALQQEQESRRLELVRPETASDALITPDAPMPSDAVAALDVLPCTTASSGAIRASGVSTTSDAVLAKSRKIHHCKIVQHGHSTNDQLVYQYLWAAGKPLRLDQPNSRRQVSLGLGQMAKEIGAIHRRNITVVIQRLIAKQSIQVIGKEQADSRTPRTYLVFSYEEILTRRKALGLEWVVRSSRGVDFIDPQTGRLLAQTASDATTSPSAARPSDASASSGYLLSLESNAVKSLVPHAVTASLLGKEQRKEKGTTTTTETTPDAVWQGLTRLDPTMDEGAMDTLWRESRAIIANLTAEELLYFFEARARLLYQNRNVKNPIGLLLKSVRDWITPRKVEARREQLRIEAEEAEQLRHELGL